MIPTNSFGKQASTNVNFSMPQTSQKLPGDVNFSMGASPQVEQKLTQPVPPPITQPQPQVATGTPLQGVSQSPNIGVNTAPTTSPMLNQDQVRGQFANKFREVMGREGTEADWAGQVRKEGFQGNTTQAQLDDYFRRATAEYGPR